MGAFWVSVGVVFVAELGDKSQLMALAFAARYRVVPVLAGITLATAVVHAVSVGLGAALGVNLPTRGVNAVAGLAFFGFAAWTLRGDHLDDGDLARVERPARHGFVAAAVAFSLAELGDKTMLATVTLASRGGLVGTWAGSTAGMVLADALALVAGRALGARLPQRAVRVGAATLFALSGLALAIEAVRG